MLTANEIKAIVQESVALSKVDGDKLKKTTVAETYHVGKLSGNRLNSGTIRSQLIICQDEQTWNDSDDDAKRAIHSDQRVFVQTGNDVWDIYKGKDSSESSDPILWRKHVSGLKQFLSVKANLEISQNSEADGNVGLFGELFDVGDGCSRMFSDILSAIRTKPFVLLAGISGTGKSRMVRQLARGCCPNDSALAWEDEAKSKPARKPGNFEMIPVRPNWHDSTELMGYVTRLTDGNRPKYVIKPFVKFLVKAAIFKDVPFFLCLDEMNLAPVEQYFAEYLSVVETRKKDGNDIVSDVLVNFDQPEIDVTKTVQELMADWIAVAADGTVSEKISGAKTMYDAIVADKGVRIPKNFIVMGTVNMDETTCSFSRKVLDRAMTFELNEVDMDKGLEKDDSITYGAIQPPSSAIATDVEGFDFYAANKDVCEKIKTYLNTINAVLDGTPFKFAYRSRNEIMLYCIERMKGSAVELPQALDEAMSMKVLSRIEGDEQKLRISKRDAANNVVKDANGHPVMVCLLDVLAETIPLALKAANDGKDPQPACTVCTDKLTYMAGRLDGGFTNFFI